MATEWLRQTGFAVGSAPPQDLASSVGMLLLEANDRATDIAEMIGAWNPARVLVVLLCPCARSMALVSLLRLDNVFCSDDGLEQFPHAVKAIAEERTYVSPSYADFSAKSGPLLAQHLTPREIEVLRLIAEGQSKKQVADQLHLSVKTVDNHCTSMMAKLDLHDRVSLARYAIRRGIVDF
ncbi:MAG: response regulator transcription factor [Phycisphaerales bacterium]